MNSEEGQQIRRRPSLLGSGVGESKDKVIGITEGEAERRWTHPHSPPPQPLLQQMQVNNGDSPSPAPVLP